jgi:uncharacterized protein YbcI
MTTQPEGSANGAVTAAISTGTVQLMHEYTGRGPTKARTTLTPDLCVIVLADGLTKAERTLVAEGDEELVLRLRRRFQRAMRHVLTDLVEKHTGQRVTAFMSDNHVDPDVAAEVFVLEPLPDAA